MEESKEEIIEGKIRRAYEKGMLGYKAFVLKLIEDWCNLDSGAQGCFSTANELKNYLKNYLEPEYK